MDTLKHEDRFLRISEVLAIVNLSKKTVYEAMKARSFPMAYRLGPRGVRWRLADIRAWMDALPRWDGDAGST